MGRSLDWVANRHARHRPPPLLSVVIPVWSDEHSLGKLLPRLSRVLDATVPGAAEIVVAAPPDEPLEQTVEREGGRVVRYEGAGYGAALRAGLREASGRWVVTMDADFSHPPEFIRTLWLRRGGPRSSSPPATCPGRWPPCRCPADPAAAC